MKWMVVKPSRRAPFRTGNPARSERIGRAVGDGGKIIALAAAIGTITGCARVVPGRGIEDVAGLVSDRAGLRVHWDVGSEADAEVVGAVERMLQEELTVATAVQIALLNNRDLQATYEDLTIAQADLVEAGLLRNPVFDAEIRFARGGGTALELSLVQDFLHVLFIPLRKARAEAEFEAAKLRVARTVLEHAGRVRQAVHALQAAEQTIEMRGAVVEATRLSQELARRLHAAGNITDLDLANEQALYEESRLDLASAHIEAAEARERLNVLMGCWGRQTHWTIAPRLPELPAEPAATAGDRARDIESMAVEASLDLGVARREIEAAARSLGVAAPLALEEITTGASAEREAGGEWSIGPAFSLPIPLFDHGQANVARAEADLRRARERYVSTAVRVRAEARVAEAAVIAAFDRAAHYRDVILPLRQRILEQTQRQYNAMQVGAFQLLQAKREQVEAGERYIEALRAYWDACADLDLLLGGGGMRNAAPPQRTRNGDHP